MEDRLIRLEEQAYFQDEKLKELDSRLFDCQRGLETLEKRLDAMSAALAEIRDFLAGGRNKGDEKPPHYHNDHW
ncbi:MAG: SlyX family protein [Desulfovibrio sp.]|nr:SlyX family protein [Desulfovibrio sp.]